MKRLIRFLLFLCVQEDFFAQSFLFHFLVDVIHKFFTSDFVLFVKYFSFMLALYDGLLHMSACNLSSKVDAHSLLEVLAKIRSAHSHLRILFYSLYFGLSFFFFLLQDSLLEFFFHIQNCTTFIQELNAKRLLCEFRWLL